MLKYKTKKINEISIFLQQTFIWLELDQTPKIQGLYIYIYILLFKGLPQFEKSFFFPQNTHISLDLNRDKIKW